VTEVVTQYNTMSLPTNLQYDFSVKKTIHITGINYKLITASEAY